jgi:hypothetical protein
VSCIKTNRNWSWLTQGGVHWVASNLPH